MPKETITIVEKIVEKIVKEEVIKELPVEKTVFQDRIKEVEVIKEMPVFKEKIKIVEVIKEVVIETGGGKGDCISEANFVTTWNKLFHIPFADNDLKDDCLSEEKFMSLIASNFKRNEAKLLKDAKIREEEK